MEATEKALDIKLTQLKMTIGKMNAVSKQERQSLREAAFDFKVHHC